MIALPRTCRRCTRTRRSSSSRTSSSEPMTAADRTRFQEAKEELSSLLSEEALAHVPFVVLGNKIDIPTAASEDELRHALGLYSHMTYGRDTKKGESSARPVELFMVSVVKRMGYAEAFQWLSQFLS